MRLFQFVRAVLLVLLVPTAWAKKPTIKSETIQADITESKLFTHLEALNNIAQDEGDGDRAFGLPGYDASVDYVWSHIANVPGTTAWKQEFSAWFGQVKSISLKVDGKDVHILPLTYSPSTPKDGITAEVVLGPEDEAGCDPVSYENLNVTGKIVLTQRFECPTGGKMASRVRPAAQNGAAAVIIYHDFTREPVSDTLGDYDPDDFVPSGYIRYASGISLKDRIESGETVVATFQHTQLYEKRTTENLLVETDEGDPENVIILGAHLDSVQGSPGINDNASGVSAILEVFKALTKYSFKNKVRFAWWGAMENGRLVPLASLSNTASHSVNTSPLAAGWTTLSQPSLQSADRPLASPATRRASSSVYSQESSPDDDLSAIKALLRGTQATPDKAKALLDFQESTPDAESDQDEEGFQDPWYQEAEIARQPGNDLSLDRPTRSSRRVVPHTPAVTNLETQDQGFEEQYQIVPRTHTEVNALDNEPSPENQALEELEVDNEMAQSMENEILGLDKYRGGDSEYLTVVTYSDDFIGAISLFKADLSDKRKVMQLGRVAMIPGVPRKICSILRDEIKPNRYVVGRSNRKLKCFDCGDLPRPQIVKVTNARYPWKGSGGGWRKALSVPELFDEYSSGQGLIATIPQMIGLLHLQHITLTRLQSSPAHAFETPISISGKMLFRGVFLNEIPKGLAHIGRNTRIAILYPRDNAWVREQFFWA
ncbi:peptidase family M28 [Fusarium albosuccineum]|uniref:Peptide hydrolase n=1 Tax=Fusarium albosuccineum TaxID=1237068 RepID=A0A8H4P784_9HYPO|nr:peptidase family M28 [Fusarium albosuccineum]